MLDTILSKLEASRKELLDLGMRNSLLNYKLSASKGLHIVEEQSSSLFNILVTEGKAMTFSARAVLDDPSATPTEFPSAAEQEELYNDTKLQTNETEITLGKRLLGTFYAARTSMEEQGVNILYLSLGMLRWFESDNSQEERQAPLVLVPVNMERSNVRERIRVKFSQEEIGENISLKAKMKVEFDIDIPSIENIEDFNITGYFHQIVAAVSGHPRWTVDPDAIELGFFSFNKFLIYTDLDNSKWPEGKKPIEHPTLQSLFQYGFRDTAPAVGENAFIDTETDAGQFFQVIDADSSQIMTMIAVREGKNLLIQGPPGTGKSQTITNLIADAVGQGKKVLFVAEKMAALDVVKRKLDSIGLGEICLELHSNKTNKKELHAELIRILNLGRPNAQSQSQNPKLLDQHREELNDYCSAVNAPVAKSRLTVQQLTGRLLQLDHIRQDIPLPKIDEGIFETWDTDTIYLAEAFADRIQARLEIIGVPDHLLFWGSRLTVLLPSEQDQLPADYQQLLESTNVLRNLVDTITSHFGLPSIQDRKAAEQLLTLCDLAARCPNLKALATQTPVWLAGQASIENLLDSGARFLQLQAKYQDILLPAAWTENVLQIRRSLLAHGHKWYKFLIGEYKQSLKELAAICKTTLPKEAEAKIQYLDDILETQQLRQSLSENETLGKELFTHRWQGVRSDFSTLKAAARYLNEVHSAIDQHQYPQEFLPYLSRNEDSVTAQAYKESLADHLRLQHQRADYVIQKLSFDENNRFAGRRLLQLPLIDQIDLISKWIAAPAEIHQVISWNTLEETANEQNLAILATLAISWDHAYHLLKAAIQKNWYQYLLDQSLRTIPALRKFQRDSHEEIIQQFRTLDKLNFQHNRTLVAVAHWNTLPAIDAGGQVNVLKREFNKKARLKPIRKVVEEAGLALQAIKPVFMMSPLSIANYLPPGAVEFDLVVFDEASQVKPVEALGAILRGKQLVVVGDSKQLPPTSFFDSLSEETDDEENVTADIQSILGMCDAQGLISKMLKWHYRSRHESLITLSNHEFYDNKLVIFPSPGSRERLGLCFHHLSDTAYDRGKTRTNPREAEEVARAVIEHATKWPNLSLGVVAFSSAQREAIDSALELLRKKNPTTETFFNRRSHEPFFVKNLENVQGDERDVIFISIGYGRTQEGYVAMSFGPLNNNGGERRLNVLITRAKLRCEVFTNITADDIDLKRTKSYGIAALKHFLHFAQHGKLNLTEETGLPADSPFEESVADKLMGLGYIVRKQVGSKGFYIDLAIVDPDNPGRYIIGIECDGAAYHSARSARDRDRLRQEVLENIGWKIHRIWSTDWFRHPDVELKRAIQVIEKAKELLSVDDEAIDAEEPVVSSAPDIAREDQSKDSFTGIGYQTASLPAGLSQMEIHLYPIGILSEWVYKVVTVESPIHFDEMAHRVAEAAGVAKVGSRIRDSLLRATAYLQRASSIQKKGEFLWLWDMQEPAVRDRSTLGNGSRKLKFICPEEIQLAMQHVVRNAIAIAPDEMIALVVRLFGFNRVTDEMRTELSVVIDDAVNRQILHLDTGLLKLKE